MKRPIYVVVLLYAFAVASASVLLVADVHSAFIRIPIFLATCLFGTVATLLLPLRWWTTATKGTVIFIAIAGLIATAMSVLGPPNPSPPSRSTSAAGYSATLKHGDSYRAYEWLSSRKNKDVELQLLVNLAPTELMGGASTFEEVMSQGATRGRDIDLAISTEGYELLRLHMLPLQRDAADYLSEEFNEFVRIIGKFRVVDVDPAVGSTQMYSVVLQPAQRE